MIFSLTSGALWLATDVFWKKNVPLTRGISYRPSELETEAVVTDMELRQRDTTTRSGHMLFYPNYMQPFSLSDNPEPGQRPNETARLLVTSFKLHNIFLLLIIFYLLVQKYLHCIKTVFSLKMGWV
jgi:hypothetical protein